MPITFLDDEGDGRSARMSPQWYAGFRHPSTTSFEEPATIAPYGRPKWGERTISVRVGNARARPREYRFPLVKTGLLVLKMQREFIDVGGFGWLLGNDTSILKEIIPNVQALLEAAREANLTIIHVKESHKDDLSDVPLSKLKRALKQSAGHTRSIGDQGPLGKYLIEGELGNEFIPECTPLPGEKVIATPGKGVFYGTELHQFCLEKGISHLIVAGVATEIEGQQVMRELNDRGYEPVMIVDCTASYFQELKDVAIEMMTAQAGLIGWCTSLDFIKRAIEVADFEESSFSPPFVLVQKDAARYPTVPILLGPDLDPLSSSHSPTSVLPEGTREEWVCFVEGAQPYTFAFPVEQTACIIVDMQRDNICDGGFGSALGNDVSPLEEILPDVQALLELCRTHDILVIHTMESHMPDLRDCPLAKLTRRKLPEGYRIGDQGKLGRVLICGEWGNAILDEVAPLPHEKVIHKPGKGAFCCTELYDYLLCQNITHLIFAGVTTDVAVQTSIFEANDRGFECLLVEDCTESYVPHFKLAALETLTAQGAIIAWTATLEQLAESLGAPPDRAKHRVSSGEVGGGNPHLGVVDSNPAHHIRTVSADTDHEVYHDAVDYVGPDSMTVCDGDEYGEEGYSCMSTQDQLLDCDTFDSFRDCASDTKSFDTSRKTHYPQWRSLSVDLRMEMSQDSEFSSPALFYSPRVGQDDDNSVTMPNDDCRVVGEEVTSRMRSRDEERDLGEEVTSRMRIRAEERALGKDVTSRMRIRDKERALGEEVTNRLRIMDEERALGEEATSRTRVGDEERALGEEISSRMRIRDEERDLGEEATSRTRTRDEESLALKSSEMHDSKTAVDKEQHTSTTSTEVNKEARTQGKEEDEDIGNNCFKELNKVEEEVLKGLEVRQQQEEEEEEEMEEAGEVVEMEEVLKEMELCKEQGKYSDEQGEEDKGEERDREVDIKDDMEDIFKEEVKEGLNGDEQIPGLGFQEKMQEMGGKQSREELEEELQVELREMFQEVLQEEWQEELAEELQDEVREEVQGKFLEDREEVQENIRDEVQAEVRAEILEESKEVKGKWQDEQEDGRGTQEEKSVNGEEVERMIKEGEQEEREDALAGSYARLLTNAVKSRSSASFSPSSSRTESWGNSPSFATESLSNWQIKDAPEGTGSDWKGSEEGTSREAEQWKSEVGVGSVGFQEFQTIFKDREEAIKKTKGCVAGEVKVRVQELTMASSSFDREFDTERSVDCFSATDTEHLTRLMDSDKTPQKGYVTEMYGSIGTLGKRDDLWREAGFHYDEQCRVVIATVSNENECPNRRKGGEREDKGKGGEPEGRKVAMDLTEEEMDEELAAITTTESESVEGKDRSGNRRHDRVETRASEHWFAACMEQGSVEAAKEEECIDKVGQNQAVQALDKVAVFRQDLTADNDRQDGRKDVQEEDGYYTEDESEDRCYPSRGLIAREPIKKIQSVIGRKLDNGDAEYVVCRASIDSPSPLSLTEKQHTGGEEKRKAERGTPWEARREPLLKTHWVERDNLEPPSEGVRKSVSQYIAFDKYLQVVPISNMGGNANGDIAHSRPNSDGSKDGIDRVSQSNNGVLVKAPQYGIPAPVKRKDNVSEGSEKEKQLAGGLLVGNPFFRGSGLLSSAAPKSATAIKTQKILSRNLPGTYREERWVESIAETRLETGEGTKSCGCIPKGFFFRNSSSNRKSGC